MEPRQRAPTTSVSSQAHTRSPKVVIPRARARGYSYDALKVLQRVWAANGGVVMARRLKEALLL